MQIESTKSDRRTRRTGGTHTRGRAERVVASVLHATREVLGRVGYGALRIEEVAMVSGVNKTTIYRRWLTKAELVAASLRAVDEELEQPDTGTLRGDLVAVVMDAVRMWWTPTGRGIVRMLQMERADPEVEAMTRDLRAQRRQRYMALLERGIARGELPADVDTELILDLVFAPVSARLLHRGEDVTEGYAAAVVDIVLSGARAVAARMPSATEHGNAKQEP